MLYKKIFRRRYLVAGLFLSVLLGVGVAQASVRATVTVAIKNSASGMALVTNGTSITQANYDSGNSRQWILHLVTDSNAYVTIVDRQTGKCIASPATGELSLETCGSSTAQQWSLVGTTAVKNIVNRSTGEGITLSTGTTVVTGKVTNATNQQFVFSAAGILKQVATTTTAKPATTSTTTKAGTTTTTAKPTQTSTGYADGVINADGTVNAVGYKAMAGQMATTTGISYRFGQSADELGTPKSTSTAYQPTPKAFTTQYNDPRTFELGTQTANQGDYSSNQGQVGYIPASGQPTEGVDTIATLEADQATYSEEPHLSWTLYGGGHPDVNLVTRSGSQAPAGVSCAAKMNSSVGHFVAQARAYAHGEFTGNTVMAFDNGFITTAGTNTAPAQQGACLQLPSGMVPTAVSVTDGNEFALVTVWNTTTLKGQLVMIVLGGSQPAGTFWSYEWSELYPGMSNYGMPTFMKYLGAIDLGINAPTSLSAVSDNSMQYGRPSAPGKQDPQRGDLKLSDESIRQLFVNGADKQLHPLSGYAVVGSRSENKAVFVDLQPLFDQVTDQYFGTRAQFDAAFNNVGLGATQFPKTFANNTAESPVVVKTVSFTQPVTAVAGMLSGGQTPRAYVATVDGQLHTFEVGGLADNSAASATAIVEKGATAVGRNVTDITYVKDKSGNDGAAAIPQTLENTLIVTSRGDRKIEWLNLTGDSVSIVRTLQDSRIVDPIAAEDNNNHGTESYLLSVADYGSGKLENFRYGPVIMHTMGGATFGMGADGKAAFEFGGQYDPKGKPFSISVTNAT